MTDRDVGAFHERASTYETGWRGNLHREIALRTADLAVATVRTPGRVLDVGSGTGLLLRYLAARMPDVEVLVGIDAAAGMVEVAKATATDTRVRFILGTAEALPFPDDWFDLVVSTTSFDHWKDQHAGLVQCARVLTPGGRLVLTDLFSLWLLPTLILGRHGRARTQGRAGALLRAAGFRSVTWHPLYALIINTAVAST